jgi:hypothetical protein
MLRNQAKPIDIRVPVNSLDSILGLSHHDIGLNDMLGLFVWWNNPTTLTVSSKVLQ